MAYGLIILVIAAVVVAVVVIRWNSWEETTARNYRKDRKRDAQRRQEPPKGE